MAIDRQHTSIRLFSPGLLVKLVVAIGLCYTLYHQLFVQNDTKELVDALFVRMHVAPQWMLAVVVTLMPINLLLEAMKFRLLLPEELRPSITNALRRVCSGLSIGLFTPNRIGEYVGRLTGTGSDHRLPTIAATFLGGVAQWIPLLGGGLICTIGFGQIGGFELGSFWTYGAAFFTCILLVLLFAFLPEVVMRVERIWSSFRQNMSLGPRMNRFFVQVAYSLRGIRRLAANRPSDVRRALLIACARYLVYLVQISLAFVFFGLDAGVEIALLGTGILLFTQTFVPLPAIVQTLARIELAVLIWQAYHPNELGLASASFLIFVLNLGFPALIGLVEILKSDVDKTLGINA